MDKQIISDISLMTIITALNSLAQNRSSPAIRAQINKAMDEITVYSNSLGYPREGV